MKRLSSLIFFLLTVACLSAQTKKLHTEVLVVGGTTGGIAAGIQSARSGAKTIIIEQTNWLGGMLTAGGVSCTDGNNELPSGIWEEFRQALYKHYQSKNLATGWVSETCFEPHVGDSIFKAMAAKEKNLTIEYGWYFDKTWKNGNHVNGASFINKKGERFDVYANVTVDATDLGDVFADAGAGYDLGTEDSLQSGEKIAPGRSNVIQDLTWAATLKDFGKGTDKTIPAPLGYNPKRYYCSTSDAPCNGKPYAFNTLKVLDYGKLKVPKGSPNKYMMNWPAHGNDSYLDVVEMKPIEREEAYAAAKNQTLGFIHFLQTELKQKNIGLAEEEMDKGMAFMPYNREGRRVRGVVRLNIDHIRSPYQYTLYRTGIAVGDYPVDHHHAQYPGKVPPIPFPQVPSFNIPLGALIPMNIKGLIVCEKGISVSNIANGTTRLQPVVLLTGQAAGVLAAQTVKSDITHIFSNPVREVQQELLKNKCFIMPFVDVKVNDPAWEAIQRVGASGIMQGTGKSISWANKTFFYPDSLMRADQLLTDIKTALKIFFYKKYPIPKTNEKVRVKDLINFFQFYYTGVTGSKSVSTKLGSLNAKLIECHLTIKKPDDWLTRKEIAVYLDHFFDLFDLGISLDGYYFVQE